LATFEKLQFDFVQNERRQETIVARVEEIQNLALIKKLRRECKKGGRGRGQNSKKQDSCSLNQVEIYLNPMKCFMFHEMGHYASLCPENKKFKQL